MHPGENIKECNSHRRIGKRRLRKGCLKHRQLLGSLVAGDTVFHVEIRTVLVRLDNLRLVMMTPETLPDREIVRRQHGMAAAALHLPVNSERPMCVGVVEWYPGFLHVALGAIGAERLMERCGGHVSLVADIAAYIFRCLGMGSYFYLFRRSCAAGTGFDRGDRTTDRGDCEKAKKPEYDFSQHTATSDIPHAVMFQRF